MNKLVVCILVAFVLPTFAAATSLKVQSGEHDGFTRLVLPLPPGATWDVKERHRSVEIQVLSSDAKFDTSQVFRRISKDRISGIRELDQGAGLMLDLACTCTVSSFVESERYLVVDIKDKISQPLRLSSYKVLPQNTPAYRFLTSRKGTALGEPGSPALERPSSEQAHREVVQMWREESEIESILTELSLAKVWRRNLRQHLESGAANGLLSRSPREDAKSRGQPPASKGEPFHSTNEQSTKTPPELMPVKASANHLSVKPAGQTDIDTAPFERAEKTRCGGSHLVDIASWGAAEDYSAQIGSRLPALFDQSGAISRNEAIDLARFYLFWGLGEEATRIVEPLPDSDPNVKAILAIAELLQDTDARGDYFAGKTDCNNVSAMWAVMATVNKYAKINTKAVLRAYSKLPAHLREVLGPTLAKRLEESGDEAAAGVVARVLKHTPDDGLAPELPEQLQSSETKEFLSQSKLEESGRTNALSAARTVMELIEQSRQSGNPVSKELVDLVSSFVVEFRGTSLEPELLRTQAIALSLAGDYSAAMRVVGLDQPPPTPGGFTDAQLQVLTLLVQRADDIAFLQYALALTSFQVSALPTSLRQSMADRLTSLGLDGAARKLMVEKKPDAKSDPRNLTHKDHVDPRGTNFPTQDQKRNNGSAPETGQDLRADNSAPNHSRTDEADRLQTDATSFDREKDVSEVGPLPPLAHARRLLRQSALLRENLRSITGDVAENR